MHKIIINDSYEFLQDFITQIESFFLQSTHTLHKARNEIKCITHEGKDLVVKSFKRPNMLRRYIYTYMKDSKAKKSYENSLVLAELTPAPIAYIEFFSSFLLDRSYFVSEHFTYDFTIREPLLDAEFQDREAIFTAFARFSFALHEKDILHLDYSPGNILIKKENDTYIFKVVDVNRMRFTKLSLRKRLENFNKLWASEEALTLIAQAYANLMNEDTTTCINIALKANNKHKNYMRLKKRLKGQKLVD